jgi:integrase
MTTRTPMSSPLRTAALKPLTHRAYHKNLTKFLHYLHLSLPQLLQLPSARIDTLLSEYFDTCYSVGDSFDYASQTLSAVVFHRPSLRHKLGESRLRLRGWRNLHQSHAHPPVTWELTVLLAVTMSKSGFHAEAIATLLAFDCYLRVGELLSIRMTDVVQPNDPRVGTAHPDMALRLPDTKTGQNQWVSIERSAVATAFRRHLQAHRFSGQDHVFPFTPHHFRNLLSSTVRSLGLSHIPYVPHSFRHGGATCAYLAGATIEQIMFRGRWASMKSARRYIQTGRALLVTVSIPLHLHEVGALLSSSLVETLTYLRKTVSANRRRMHRQRRAHSL